MHLFDRYSHTESGNRMQNVFFNDYIIIVPVLFHGKTSTEMIHSLRKLRKLISIKIAELSRSKH